ncbi:hypothetical protein P8C59_000228 [Phyllachora maydis]|uniref:NFACT RNA-binding domain-containing protein n=1 Tax=Phyllachora maydis TaxID=1825666 RepID=A0AAD9HVR1_9PEZI|nr:hypothetical protein P8C59_000228 [Phyllachora maydis]
MVYYFTSTVVDPPAFVYVGKDKFENEELIKYGWEEDVWVRRQLTKANSIEGNKKDNITVIYTPWSNLKKDGSMAVGQTKVEKQPDFQQEKEERLRELRKRQQTAQQARTKEEARAAEERQEKKWQKDHAYDNIFSDETMAANSNQDRAEDWEDDFM